MKVDICPRGTSPSSSAGNAGGDDDVFQAKRLLELFNWSRDLPIRLERIVAIATFSDCDNGEAANSLSHHHFAKTTQEHKSPCPCLAKSRRLGQKRIRIHRIAAVVIDDYWRRRTLGEGCPFVRSLIYPSIGANNIILFKSGERR